MANVLYFCGTAACLLGLLTPFVLHDPLGVVRILDRVLTALPGLVAGIQFFALAMIVEGVADIRRQLNQLLDDEGPAAQRPAKIEPPPGWD